MNADESPSPGRYSLVADCPHQIYIKIPGIPGVQTLSCLIQEHAPEVGHVVHVRWNTPDPAYIQHNIETLSKIGGVYDLLAAQVELDHAELLAKWRLDTGAK